jgi:hypothetical protein
MTILVSDTSVIIDLERGHLLDACFRLPQEFAVPQLLYDRELAEFGGPELVKLGLRVEELTPTELTAVQTIRRAHPKLSVPDSYAYALASGRQWTLLTGDAELRAVAQAKAIPFFGALWVCDQLFDEKTIAAETLADGLATLAAHPRCRLPRAEIQSRLARYKKADDR